MMCLKAVEVLPEDIRYTKIGEGNTVYKNRWGASGIRYKQNEMRI